MLENSKSIFCSNPGVQCRNLKAVINQQILDVLESGNYILGPQVESFEKQFAKFSDCNYAVGVASGTDALILALLALNIGPQDQVITTAHTALATIAAIIAVGATPVCVDIQENSYNIDPTEVSNAINEKTKAIIAVHLYGEAADLSELLHIANKHNIPLIEDCAQAHGARYKNQRVGSFGICGCFSMYPTKNLGAIGDAGIITTNNLELANKLIMLRQYGWDKTKQANITGINSRLDELQAAILNIKLNYLNRFNLERQTIAARYIEHLTELTYIKLPNINPNSEHVYHLFVIQCDSRDQFIKFLNSKNIYPGIHYNPAVFQHLGYKNLIHIKNKLNNTLNILDKIISLPIYPGLTNEQQNIVIAACKEYSMLNTVCGR